MRSATIRSIFVASILSASLGACAVFEGRQSTGEYVDDATISTQVRSKIVGDQNLKLTQIDVETFKGTVQLSGFVETNAMKSHASDVARSVKGVQSVKNDLVVRPRT